MDPTQDSTATDARQRRAISQLAQSWIDAPHGKRAESGLCQSDLDASNLRRALAREGAMFRWGLLEFLAEKEKSDPANPAAAQLREVMDRVGLEAPPPPKHSPGLARLFSR